MLFASPAFLAGHGTPTTESVPAALTADVPLAPTKRAPSKERAEAAEATHL
ncbi:MAG TPA: hypothetical protein VFR86_21110 [Burkholderiaceae bacterium]|nr:hypothetical protein [Burkholderiaceae bacterium]